ncbi:hypothetical protein MRX96_015291 [Rhipicephalus microplus]
MASSGGAKVCWMLIWLLLLIFAAFWVASFAAFWYILVYVLVPCIPAAKDVAALLHRGVLLPYFCADNMVNGRDINSGIQFICSGGTVPT